MIPKILFYNNKCVDMFDDEDRNSDEAEDTDNTITTMDKKF